MPTYIEGHIFIMWTWSVLALLNLIYVAVDLRLKCKEPGNVEITISKFITLMLTVVLGPMGTFFIFIEWCTGGTFIEVEDAIKRLFKRKLFILKCK